MAEQDSLNFAATLHAGGAKRCDEDEGLGRLDRRRLVHVDSIVEQEVDDMPTSSQHREPQELRGVRCGGENIRRTCQELAKRRCVAAAGQVECIDGRRVAQARPVRARSQRRALLALVDERSRQLANLLVDHASCRYVGDRDLERGTKMREPFACQRARDRQKIVAMLERKMSDTAVLSLTAKPLAEEAFLCLALVREVAPEERPEQSVSLNAVVEPIDQRLDSSVAADTCEKIAADEGMVRLWVGKESTMFHRALVSAGVWIGKSVSFLSPDRVVIARYRSFADIPEDIPTIEIASVPA